MEREIKKKVLLLDGRGRLRRAGYARQMQFIYNRDCVRSFPLRLKEWDFYQIQKGHLVLQMTIGHVSYMCSVSAALMDLDTGEKYESGIMRPLFVPQMETDPEGMSHLQYRQKDFSMSFLVKRDRRILRMRGGTGAKVLSEQGAAKGVSAEKERVEIDLTLTNDPANEKMVIATPFAHPTQFYLNYKENYYMVAGKVCFGDREEDFTGATGLLDWGRGVWPYSHQWFWGSATARLDESGRPVASMDGKDRPGERTAGLPEEDGVPFGLNIGWGFGDLSHATENMFFYRRKAYKIRGLKVKKPKRPEPKRKMEGVELKDTWMLRDTAGKLSLEFTPFFDNYTARPFVVVETHCHQLFGTFRGYVITEEGRIPIDGVNGFIEHAVNRW